MAFPMMSSLYCGTHATTNLGDGPNLIMPDLPSYWHCSWCGSLQSTERIKCANCGGNRENKITLSQSKTREYDRD